MPQQIGQSHDGDQAITDPPYFSETPERRRSTPVDWGNPCGFTFDDFFQWGRDAVKDGSPKRGYAPYAYPHPLRG